MSIQIVEINFDWPLPANSKSDGQHDVGAVIRRAVSEPYEKRKWLGSGAPESVVFILDRRVNWGNFPRSLEDCLGELRRPERVQRNQGSYQWAVAAKNYGHEIFPIPGSLPELQRPDPEEMLTKTKTVELEEMVSDPAVFFHHRRSSFFLLPSGNISDYFLRVGNIQKNVHNLECLSYWSLPFLRNVDHVVAESWTISTTAAYMSQYLSYYDPTGKCTWSYLEKYLTANSEDSQHIQELLRSRETSESDVLFVVSASATGRLNRRFDRLLLGDPNASRFKRLTLFALKDQGDGEPVLHSLTRLLEDHNLLGAPPDEGVGDAEVIEIDKSTYIPVHRDTKLVKFNVNGDTKRAKEFFHKYAGNKIFSVFRKGKSSRLIQSRHHSFHVDILKLMDHPHFRKALAERFKKLGKMDAIIFVSSEANDKFRDIVQEVHSREFSCAKVPSISVGNFNDIFDDDNIFSFLKANDNHVIFLESIFITGGNLRDLSPTIRKMSYNGRATKALITYLVGLYRPHSRTKEQWSKSTFGKASNHEGFRGRMECVEEVLLPLLAEEACPWQRELDAHVAVMEAADLEPAETAYILERIGKLRDAMVSGLRGRDVFFRKSGHGDFEFSPGSYFLDIDAVIESNREVDVVVDGEDIDEADLACAVASVMHTWRCRASSGRVFIKEVPFDNLINPDVITGNNTFNDSKLRAAIWRALRPSEVVLQRSDSDTRSFLTRALCDDSEGNADKILAGEAMLAFSWQIRQAIGNEKFDQIQWQYLKELSKVVRDL